MAEKTLHRWGSGGKIGGKVCPSGAAFASIWCNLRPRLVQLLLTSDATFVPIWCNLRPCLVQPSPEGGEYK